LKNIHNRGGKRAGAGRPPAPYQTKAVTFRIAIEGIPELRAFVESNQTKWKNLNQAETKKLK
jgi:hypothetical protein